MVEKKKIVSSQSTDYTLHLSFEAKKDVFDVLEQILNYYGDIEFLFDPVYTKNYTKNIFDFGCISFIFDPDDKNVPVILNLTRKEIDVIIIRINGFEKLVNKIFEYFEF